MPVRSKPGLKRTDYGAYSSWKKRDRDAEQCRLLEQDIKLNIGPRSYLKRYDLKPEEFHIYLSYAVREGFSVGKGNRDTTPTYHFVHKGEVAFKRHGYRRAVAFANANYLVDISPSGPGALLNKNFSEAVEEAFWQTKLLNSTPDHPYMTYFNLKPGDFELRVMKHRYSVNPCFFFFHRNQLSVKRYTLKSALAHIDGAPGTVFVLEGKVDLEQLKDMSS